MNIIKYPTEADVSVAITADDPLLVLISFNGETVLVCQIDEAMEHHILLAKAGFPSSDIDKYFRLVVDSDGADWTFDCPSNYKGIQDKTRRIEAFYMDGFTVIPAVLHALGYMVGINIPRRHIDILREFHRTPRHVDGAPKLTDKRLNVMEPIRLCDKIPTIDQMEEFDRLVQQNKDASMQKIIKKIGRQHQDE